MAGTSSSCGWFSRTVRRRAVGDERAEAGVRRLDADAEEREPDLGERRCAPSAAEAPTMMSGMTFGSRCWKRMRGVDAPLASRGDDVLGVAQRQHLRADEARAADPAEEREHAEDQEVVGEARV